MSLIGLDKSATSASDSSDPDAEEEDVLDQDSDDIVNSKEMLRIALNSVDWSFC